jgi:hypothetical protein
LHNPLVKGLALTLEPIDFTGLVAAFRHTDAALADQAVKAVNISLTLRNWCFGCYLAEFEQRGADRAQYGARLMEEVSSRLTQEGVAGVAPRSLRQYRQFYMAYPSFLQTPSAKSLAMLLPGPIWQTLSAKWPAAGHGDATAVEPASTGVPAHLLLERLSFSHFAELLQLDDPLQRAFYEVEALRGHWSVRELKRQIGTQYYHP